LIADKLSDEQDDQKLLHQATECVYALAATTAVPAAAVPTATLPLSATATVAVTTVIATAISVVPTMPVRAMVVIAATIPATADVDTTAINSRITGVVRPRITRCVRVAVSVVSIAVTRRDNTAAQARNKCE
jgi:hypothetical protein